MIDAAILRLWLMRALYRRPVPPDHVLQPAAANTAPSRVAGSRPDHRADLRLGAPAARVSCPPLAVAAVVLLADLMFQRPPGLWAALVLAMTEMPARRAQRQSGENAFLLEWMRVATAWS